MNIKQVKAELDAARRQAQDQVQAVYEAWLQRIQPRLDALAVQTQMLAEQLDGLQKIATVLQVDVESAIRIIQQQVK